MGRGGGFHDANVAIGMFGSKAPADGEPQRRPELRANDRVEVALGRASGQGSLAEGDRDRAAGGLWGGQPPSHSDLHRHVPECVQQLGRHDDKEVNMT